MSKSTYFFGQPLYSQITFLLDKDKILKISQELKGERYIKKFDIWHHLNSMLYATISRLDSLREIEMAMTAESRKLRHLGLTTVPKRSTLADANEKRPEGIFGAIYADLYNTTKDSLLSDSRTKDIPQWMKKLLIIDSTTISLFSNLIFKGVGRNPKTGKKKGGLKVHSILRATEGVPCDIQFSSSAIHDHFMLSPEKLTSEDIVAFDRAYINYEKFEKLTENKVIYVTKMKRNLKYELESDTFYQNQEGKTVCREQIVVFRKELAEKTINHKARIISYTDIEGKNHKKPKLISLLTNDFNMNYDDIIAIYKKRWQIESLFKQLKQNFPLKYFYGESENAIKIQVWVVLIANLLLTIMKKKIKCHWSFSGMATVIRILLMQYIKFESFFESPEKDLKRMLEEAQKSPPAGSYQLSLF